jgi:hypothetical protein
MPKEIVSIKKFDIDSTTKNKIPKNIRTPNSSRTSNSSRTLNSRTPNSSRNYTRKPFGKYTNQGHRDFYSNNDPNTTTQLNTSFSGKIGGRSLSVVTEPEIFGTRKSNRVIIPRIRLIDELLNQTEISVNKKNEENVLPNCKIDPDHPCWEMLNAIVIVGAEWRRCNNIEDIIKLVSITPKIQFANQYHRDSYIKDLRNRGALESLHYLQICEEKMPLKLKMILNSGINVKECYVYGKTVPGNSEFHTLNAGLDKKMAKGDIAVKLIDNTWLAIDNKKSEDCTSSNYAVWESPKGGIVKSFENSENCIKALQQTHASMEDNSRQALQEELYDSSHVVWSNYEAGIEENLVELKNKLIQLLFCHDAQKKYPIYKFDGTQWIDYSEYNEIYINFERSTLLRHRKESGRVAKIFYILTVEFNDGRPSMPVECFLRFKFTNFKVGQIVGKVIAQLNMIPHFPGSQCQMKSVGRDFEPAKGGGGGAGGGGNSRSIYRGFGGIGSSHKRKSRRRKTRRRK